MVEWHMSSTNTGLIQLYYGNGKGKTTAAVGQAVRAAGQGMRVCFVQFLKHLGCPIGERVALDHLARNITFLIHEYPPGLYVNFQVTDKERFREEIRRFIGSVKMAANSGQFDMLILDELGNVLDMGLTDEATVSGLLTHRPKSLEVVITGNRFPESLIHLADLVTEFQNKKHPFQEGVPARKGIEY